MPKYSRTTFVLNFKRGLGRDQTSLLEVRIGKARAFSYHGYYIENQIQGRLPSMARRKKKKPNNQATSASKSHEKGSGSNRPKIRWSPVPEDRKEKIGLFGMLILIISTYIYTLWPTVAGGDAGELTGAACSLGVPHPPGYPTYTMLAHLMTHLPLGSVAWRVNLLSAVFTVLACLFLFGAVQRFTRSTAAGLATIGVFAFSPLIWRYSTHAEVFSLNILFNALLAYLFVLYLEYKDKRIVYLLAFTLGLGVSNHHTIVFTGIPLGAYIAWTERKVWLRPMAVLQITLLGFLGLLPYLYLPWSSARRGYVSWGDTTTWKGFLTHFFRKEYGTLKLASSGTDKTQFFYGIWYYLVDLAEHLGYLGLFIVLFSLYYYLKIDRKHKKVFLLFLIIPSFYLIFFHALANLPYVEGAKLYRDIVSRFWIQGHTWFFLIAGFGLAPLLARSRAPKTIALTAAFLCSLIQLSVHFNAENHHDNWTFKKFGEYLLKPVKKDAIFLTLGDINTNSVRYLQACEGYRTDVKVMDRSLMSYPWQRLYYKKHFPDVIVPKVAYFPTHEKGYNLKEFFDANIHRHPIHATYIKNEGAIEASDNSWKEKYALRAWGLSFEVYPKGEELNIEAYIKEASNYLIDMEDRYRDGKPREDTWDHVIYNNYWLAHHLQAVEILKAAMVQDFNTKYLEIVKQRIEGLIKSRGPTAPVDYFKNLGIAYHHLARQASDRSEVKDLELEMMKNWKVYLKRSKATQSKTYRDILQIMTIKTRQYQEARSEN